jgi:(E)-4-hydroxy-3-methylbut-2-enyl-diphosphate synthase
MSLRPFRNINRKKTRVINVGDVKIGGDNPISVQSMTNTLTTDVKATIDQINAIHEEGADIVRVSCPDEDSTKALKEITNNVKLPVIADIHFHYKRAIEAAENGAKCLRINPGNIGDKQKIHDVLSSAKNNDCSIRIGVNAGSLEKDILEKYKEPCPEALVESALRNIKVLEDQNFFNFKVSVKSSDVFFINCSLSPTFKSNGLSIAPWNYRSWKFCLWQCKVVYWTWNFAFRRNWGHNQNFTF